MGTSNYFGSQVASIPHLERGSEIVRDLRSDVDAAFLLIEADLGAVVGGLTTGSILIGAAGVPAQLPLLGAGKLLVGSATTATSVAVTGVLGNLTAAGVTSFDQTNYGEQKACYTAQLQWSAVAAAGVVGAHLFQNATTDAVIPDNAVITNVRLDCVTPLVSAGAATVSIGIETAVDVKAITPYTVQPFNGTLSLEAVAIKTTSAQNVTATVAGADVTAGKVVALIDYFVTE
jgi:hypothetical protein